LHFLLAGALLFGAARWRADAGGVAAAQRIVVTAADRERLQEDFRSQFGRLPTGDEEQALVAEHVDEEFLSRQAVEPGLDQGDRVVNYRLAQLARFLGEDDGLSPEQLVARARALGLDRSDLVVRRYLVQSMRLLASRPAPDDVPDEAALRAYLARHAARFTRPERLHLVHVYFSRDRRGGRLQADADALLARLRASDADPAAATAAGDPFIRGHEMRAASAQDLARAFGPDFAAAVVALPVGSWQGPVTSAYGLHVVRVLERTPGGLPSLEAVRNQVVHGLLKERKDARLAARLEAWRGVYDVSVEDADVSVEDADARVEDAPSASDDA
jgi:parvulin-like peptidyl-prolyl isomerase